MLIKETGHSVNFIDKNDCFVGFGTLRYCCEIAGFTVVDDLAKLQEDPINHNPLSLDGYWFDTSIQPIEDLIVPWVYDGDVVAFTCVNEAGDIRYLVLYNEHNGYYHHGWETSWGCEGFI